MQTSIYIQLYFDIFALWYKIWCLKINESRSVHKKFILNFRDTSPISFNNIQIQRKIQQNV